MPRGMCRLCRVDKELALSHLTPRGVHKRLGRNPVLVTADGVLPVSKQTKAHALCHDCERLMNDCGERKTLGLIADENSRSPLYETLRTLPADVDEPDVQAYDTTRYPGIDVRAMVHFAIGLFWKASLDVFDGTLRNPILQLGNTGEEMRTFLLGGTFPKDAALQVVAIPSGSVPRQLPERPYEIKQPTNHGIRTFSAYVPGIQFMLWLGSVPRGTEIPYCVHRHPLHPIIVSDISEDVNRLPQRVHAQGVLARKKRQKRR